MRVVPSELPGVLILEPRVYSDHRGCFYESWNARAFADAAGIADEFVQDNHAYSVRNVLRGIHYQVVQPQGKLVRVAAGTVFDVVVDLRRSSPTFARWVSIEISAENRRQVWVPPGFGHGYLVRSPAATVLYKATEYWIPEYDRCIRWNDPDIAIDWPLADGDPVLSDRDAGAPGLRDAEVYA
jgi:dTDP-4-dehydrorhamnose 3,5-epimerase